jgi:hypothetical protein
MKPLYFATGLLFAACSTAEQQIADDQNWCLRYGYQLGSQGMADCISREQQTKYLGHEMIRAGILSSIK